MIRFLRTLWVILKVRFTTPDLRKPVTGDEIQTDPRPAELIRKKRTEVDE